MGKDSQLGLVMTKLDPATLKTSLVPPVYQSILDELVAKEPALAVSPHRCRFKVAEALANQRTERAVTSSLYLLASGRVVTRSPLGGERGFLEIVWFDPGGDVRKLELGGVRNGDDWLPSPSGERVAMMATSPYGILEVELDSGTTAVPWKLDPAKMAWFIYDYITPDRMLLVVGMRSGPDRALLVERQGDALVEIAALDDVTCDEFRVAGRFAFLKGDNDLKREILAIDGNRILRLGTQVFPGKPWDLTSVGNEIVWSSGNELYRVDGLEQAAQAAGGESAPAVPAPPTARKLSGFELQRALLDALHIAPGPGFRAALLAALRMAEGTLSFFVNDIPAPDQTASGAGPSHALLVWMYDRGIELYLIPSDGLSGALDGALDRASGSFQEHIDVGDAATWAANVRIMAALGEPGDIEGLLEVFVEPAEQEWGEWADHAPSREELESSFGAWKARRVGGAADLGCNITRVCALQMLS
jgi:hypothetical protein